MSYQEENPSFLSNLQSPQHKYDNKKNQLLEDATYIYTYDERGNLKGKVNKATNAYTYYTFNGLNQLTAVYTVNQDDEITHYLRYEYDAFNRRVSKEENTVKHTYLYDKENIIAILDKNKNTLATIVHHPTLTDTPLSITNVNGTFYYHRDHQGSIIALSDEAGQIVESIAYDNTYGKVLKHFKQEENLTLNPYGYTGREMDADDLYYYRARYYDPNTQRFLSLDPIGFEAGDFNFYRYVGNDPVNYVDPSGLNSWSQAVNTARGANNVKDVKDQIEEGIGRTEAIKECYKRAARICPGDHYVDQPKVCRSERKIEELKCNKKDVIDALRGAMISATGAGSAVVDALGGYDTPSNESNTSKSTPVGRESNASSQGQGWIVVTDENGTITNSASYGF